MGSRNLNSSGSVQCSQPWSSSRVPSQGLCRTASGCVHESEEERFVAQGCKGTVSHGVPQRTKGVLEVWYSLLCLYEGWRSWASPGLTPECHRWLAGPGCHTDSDTERGPMLSLMLCYDHPEILNNLEQRPPRLHTWALYLSCGWFGSQVTGILTVKKLRASAAAGKNLKNILKMSRNRRFRCTQTSWILGGSSYQSMLREYDVILQWLAGILQAA